MDGRSTELDALGQWQITTPVHGASLTPHVRLPSIGTRLSTAAGVFFAAEGTTDFRATGTDVDIGDAAV